MPEHVPLPLRALLVSSFALAALFAVVAPARADDEPPSGYQPLVEQGLHESAEGRWEEARAFFREAHALYPNARTSRAIGIASYEIRDYTSAYRALVDALADTRKPLTDAQRAEAESVLTRVRTFLGRYTLEALAEDATILVDGVAATPERDRVLLLTVGHHVVVVTSRGRTLRSEWTVQGGENEPLPVHEITPTTSVLSRDDFGVTTPPPPVETAREKRRRSLRRAGFVSLASGLGLAVTGAVFVALGHHDNADVSNAAPGTPWSSLESTYDRGHLRLTLGYVFLGTGLAIGATGTLLVLRGRPEDVRGATLRISPLAATWRVRW